MPINHFTLKFNKDLSVQLQAIDLEETDLIKRAQKSITCIKDALSKLKTFVLEHKFKNEGEEIKPALLSQLMYNPMKEPP